MNLPNDVIGEILIRCHERDISQCMFISKIYLDVVKPQSFWKRRLEYKFKGKFHINLDYRDIALNLTDTDDVNYFRLYIGDRSVIPNNRFTTFDIVSKAVKRGDLNVIKTLIEEIRTHFNFKCAKYDLMNLAANIALKSSSKNKYILIIDYILKLYPPPIDLQFLISDSKNTSDFHRVSPELLIKLAKLRNREDIISSLWLYDH